MTTYIATFAATLMLGLGITPWLIRVARRYGLVDDPGLRKVHASAVPRIGGVAIAAPTLLISFVVYRLNNAVGEAFREVSVQVLAFLLAGVFIFAVGLYDDVRGIRARNKLLAQLVAAAVVCAAGIRIEDIGLTANTYIELGILSVPLTLFWIVGVTNAVNLIDGLDGLAGGVSAIACGVIALFAFHSGDQVMVVVMLALLGSLCGFLVFNFNPAKVFMGDSGSLFLGFVLATASVLTSHTQATAVGLLLPLLALGVPIFDTLFSMVRRVLERRSMFAADRGHIHHKLLEMGLNQRQVVLVIYGLSLAAAAMGGLMLMLQDATRFVPFAVSLLVLVLAFRVIGVVRLRESLGRLHRNRAIMRERATEQEQFHEAALCFQNISDIQEWWASVCMAAEILHFSGLRLRFERRHENEPDEVFSWKTEADRFLAGRNDQVQITVPVGSADVGRRMSLSATLAANGSLEAAARRSALLGRLIDENAPVFEPAAAGERRARRRAAGEGRGEHRPLRIPPGLKPGWLRGRDPVSISD